MYTHNCNTSLYDIIAYINYIIIRLRHSKRLSVSFCVSLETTKSVVQLLLIIIIRIFTRLAKSIYCIICRVRSDSHVTSIVSIMHYCGVTGRKQAESLDESIYTYSGELSKTHPLFDPPPNILAIPTMTYTYGFIKDFIILSF